MAPREMGNQIGMDMESILAKMALKNKPDGGPGGTVPGPPDETPTPPQQPTPEWD